LTKGAVGLCRLDRKAAVEVREEDLFEAAIGRRIHAADISYVSDPLGGLGFWVKRYLLDGNRPLAAAHGQDVVEVARLCVKPVYWSRLADPA